MTSPTWSAASSARASDFLDDDGAQFGSGDLGERAAELADGGAGGGDDDVFGHEMLRCESGIAADLMSADDGC